MSLIERYDKVRLKMDVDSAISSLRKIEGSLEETLTELKIDIGKREARIILKNNLGYDKKTFEKILSSGKKPEVYYNPRLKIFIKGKPVKREEGSYCRITEELIS